MFLKRSCVPFLHWERCWPISFLKLNNKWREDEIHKCYTILSLIFGVVSLLYNTLPSNNLHKVQKNLLWILNHSARTLSKLPAEIGSVRENLLVVVVLYDGDIQLVKWCASVSLRTAVKNGKLLILMVVPLSLIDFWSFCGIMLFEMFESLYHKVSSLFIQPLQVCKYSSRIERLFWLPIWVSSLVWASYDQPLRTSFITLLTLSLTCKLCEFKWVIACH